jgi:prepilin-type N-terminal cleavage/methylation domain-containing protein
VRRKFFQKSENQAFTLLEILVAVGLLGVLSIMAAAAFTNVSRMQKRIFLENAIQEDARILMEQITNLARYSTIDYEQYYNRNVLQHFLNPSDYTDNYGYYATMFYDPGSNPSANDTANGRYGAYYNNSAPATKICEINLATRKLNLTSTSICPPDTTGALPPTDANFNVILSDTLDRNTGANPFPNNVLAAYSASAFCDDNKGDANVPKCINGATSLYDQLYLQKELYLISQDGATRYVIGREKFKDNHFLVSLLQLDGIDENMNGVAESWQCGKGFDCNGISSLSAHLTTASTDIANLYKGFVPISPLRSNVVDLKFFVSPLEDPRKGFNENETYSGLRLPNFHRQPQITIVLTLEPAQSELSGIDGEIPRFTLQTSVSSRVQWEVPSYGR